MSERDDIARKINKILSHQVEISYAIDREVEPFPFLAEQKNEIKSFGEQGIDVLGELYKDEKDLKKLILIVRMLEIFGENALDVLSQSLDNEYPKVRHIVVEILGDIGEPALDVLSKATESLYKDVRTRAVIELGEFGEKALPILEKAYGDNDKSVRYRIIQSYSKIGEPALELLVHAIEDQYGQNVETAIKCMVAVNEEKSVDLIINELVIRKTGRSSDLFNAQIVANAFTAIENNNPRLRGDILRKLRDIAFEFNGEVRYRSITIARTLSNDEFAALVKERSHSDIPTTTTIMHILGGNEAAAYFAELDSRSLEEFRAPLIGLEKISHQRWEELTSQAEKSFYVSIGLSIGVFFVGTGIVVWGLLLLTRSDITAQQIGGAILSGLAVVMTTFSARYWKDPVEHIQKFSAQQAQLQAAFIGYMNRISQIRIIFEREYSEGLIDLSRLLEYQQLLDGANEQAAQQLSFRSNMT